MNMASPKLKNRYRSFTASWYAFKMCSRPARAETSITRVDSGRWKLVIRQSRILKLVSRVDEDIGPAASGL